MRLSSVVELMTFITIAIMMVMMIMTDATHTDLSVIYEDVKECVHQ